MSPPRASERLCDAGKRRYYVVAGGKDVQVRCSPTLSDWSVWTPVLYVIVVLVQYRGSGLISWSSHVVLTCDPLYTDRTPQWRITTQYRVVQTFNCSNNNPP